MDSPEHVQVKRNMYLWKLMENVSMQEMPSFAQFVKGLHIEYLKCYENLVGFSKFCELQPKWCIPVGGTSGIHSVCVCEHHQNSSC